MISYLFSKKTISENNKTVSSEVSGLRGSSSFAANPLLIEKEKMHGTRQ